MKNLALATLAYATLEGCTSLQSVTVEFIAGFLVRGVEVGVDFYDTSSWTLTAVGNPNLTSVVVSGIQTINFINIFSNPLLEILNAPDSFSNHAVVPR